MKTVSLLKSELTNDKIRPKKLNITKKNCKKVKEIILLLKIFTFLKFLTEIKLNTSKKRMFIIDHGVDTLIYLKEKDS